MSDTAARLLRLLGLLQARPYWSGAELARRLEVTDRSVRRDIDRLRGLGYPVESAHGRGGGYRLASGSAMPPLVFDDASAVAVAVGLRLAAGTGIEGLGEDSLRALTVLDQVMPARLRPVVSALAGSTSALPRGPETVRPEVLLGLARGARTKVRVRFSYQDRTGAASERDVEPYHVVSMHQRWYLMAYDLARDDWRTFRLDRVTADSLYTTTFTFAPRPAPDPGAYIRQSVLGGRDEVRARVRVGLSADAVRRVVPQHAATVEDEAPGQSVLTTSTGDLAWLAFQLSTFEAPVEVLEPESLRATMRTMAARLRAAAGD
ncbi:helix-turn-helix transcriptional regulator [Tomitella fengzijianii]|uniref:YafY family transcriptional regulator n=1 Tax=Tomitella fengzijianii TaxID=2597660 RepID=A0A516X3E5_9ACTN|nr:YafY family protein [Tomitella fengzijianii]QDQ97574.1 YafY family transcriptional regulator [Tomitella fengzijianii]